MLDKLYEKASDDSIRVFATGLRQLLMASPLGARNVLAIDPGFRTGCKVVCLDKQGKLLFDTKFALHMPPYAIDIIPKLVTDYNIEAIAIGDGTAGRETDAAIRALNLPIKIPIVTKSCINHFFTPPHHCTSTVDCCLCMQ
jgi:uncharacterized protein